MPRISPNAQEMAFSFQGDIWIHNFNTQQSKRLTIHEGYESNPVWNSSGDQLAFSSNRKGANNIFTIKKTGGIPKQLNIILQAIFLMIGHLLTILYLQQTGF